MLFFEQTSSHHILIALAGGIIPALIWLLFWIREDSHPEPRWRIFFAFILGMASVILAIGVQYVLSTIFFEGIDSSSIVKSSLLIGTIAIILSSFVEEFFKYISAYFGGIHTRDADEPIDIVVYMLAAGLGFAAFENALYIFTPIVLGETTTAIITGNLRFIGATLLHVGTSLILGFILAFSLFKNKRNRRHYLAIGLITVTLLHAVFNLLIILYEDYTVFIFAAVWLGLIASLFIFEKLKKIHLNRIQ